MNISDMTYIGSGAQADIYLYEGKAVKLYKLGPDKSEGMHEAAMQNMAFERGLPTPEVFSIAEIDGRTAIIMEYISGKSLGEMMLEDIDKAEEYLSLSVDLQMRIHAVDAGSFPTQADKLRNCILDTSYLDSMQRLNLLQKLQSLQARQNPQLDNRLCHGDYHVLNLIKTERDVKIIDWVCASSGSPLADVCRSYVLYLLYMKEIAEAYLNSYCSKAHIDKQSVLDWLPVVAAARLNENLGEGHAAILLNLVGK